MTVLHEHRAPTLELDPGPLAATPAWPAPPVGPGSGVAGTAGTGQHAEPAHCGRPMAVRRLDPLVPGCRANQAVVEAALAGERVHACSCGYLLTLPADPAELLCAVAEQPVFAQLFLSRVHAAAGALESVQWACDQLALTQPAPEGPGGQWLYEADQESAAWAVDAAELDLTDAVRLATVHGVPAQLLVEAAEHHQPVETTGVPAAVAS